MNDIVNKFLLAGDKFMPEMYLKQPGFNYSACGTFTKNKERIQKFKETGDTKYIYRNELDKACFQHDIVYGDFKDLARRTVSEKNLRDKAFNINVMDIKEDWLLWFIYFLIKKTAGSRVKSMPQNRKLSEKRHKPIIRKFFKKVYSSFKENIWGADLADIQSISKFNKEFRFLLCVIDIFSKYTWVVLFKEKNGVTIVNAFQSIFGRSNRKPKRIWVDKDSEFYNNSLKKWLQGQ